MSITEYAAGTRLSCHSQANGAKIATVATIGRRDPQRPLECRVGGDGNRRVITPGWRYAPVRAQPLPALRRGADDRRRGPRRTAPRH